MLCACKQIFTQKFHSCQTPIFDVGLKLNMKICCQASRKVASTIQKVEKLRDSECRRVFDLY